MSIDSMWILFILSVIFGFVGRYISIQKNRSNTEGFLFGFFFSVFGLIIISLLPTKQNVKTVIPLEQSKSINKESIERKSIDRNKLLLIIMFIVILSLFFYTGFVRGDFKL